MDDSISRQAAIDAIARWLGYLDEDMIRRIQIGLKRLPSAQTEIIYCKDCQFTDGKGPIADGRYWCVLHAGFMDFCSDAERRTDE